MSGEDLVTQERKKIEDLLRSRGMQRSSYPPFSVAVKGQKVYFMVLYCVRFDTLFLIIRIELL